MLVKTLINILQDRDSVTIERLMRDESECPEIIVDCERVGDLKRYQAFAAIGRLNIVEITIGRVFNDLIIITK